MNENYMALCVSILKGTSPEISFKLLNSRKPKGIMSEILQMRNNGMTYKQIGESLNMTLSAVHKRILRFSKG